MLVRLFSSEVILSAVGKLRIIMESRNLELRNVERCRLFIHGWELLSTENYRETKETFRRTEMEKKGAEH